MNLLSATLDLLGLLIAVGYVVARFVRYRRVRVDHVLLFTVGFAYYVSLSSLLAHAHVLPASFENAFRSFDRVPSTRRTLASLWSVLAISGFLTASTLAARRPRRPRRTPSTLRIRASVAPATLVAAGALGLFLLAAVVYRAVLLEGYRSGDPTQIQEQAGRGTLAGLATASAIASLFALHAAASATARRSQRVLAGVVGALAIGIPVLVLPVGGNRLYSVTLLLVVAVWAAHRLGAFRRVVLVGIGAIGFVALVALGSLRLGQLPSPSTSAFYASSESVFGGWSRDLYLGSRRETLPPVAIPRYLASDLVNLAPRALLPGKDALRLDPAQAGFDLVSPLGGTHITASMWLNFGYIGSLGVIAAIAVGMRRLQLHVLAEPSSTLTMTYTVFSATLALPFFRDEFGISIVRWAILNGVVIVGLIHLATRVVAVGLTEPPPRRVAAPLVS